MSTASNDRNKQTDPIEGKDEVRKNPDPKIDQDFKGFPDAPADEDQITPKDGEDRKTAQTDVKDGEKMSQTGGTTDEDELQSDGSGGAFEKTEAVPARKDGKKDDGNNY